MEFINSNFPEGLRVLAVDDNPVCLKFVEALLKECRYEVTTTPSAEFAIDLVRKNKENFDIVITDIETDERNGFMLLKTIGLEMGLPVLMVSPDNDRETLLKGIKHGACGYLVKPPSLKQIQNIGQLVLTHKKTKSILSKILKKREIQNRMKKYLSDLKDNCPGTSQISHLGVTLNASIDPVVNPQPHVLPSTHSNPSGDDELRNMDAQLGGHSSAVSTAMMQCGSPEPQQATKQVSQSWIDLSIREVTE